MTGATRAKATARSTERRFGRPITARLLKAAIPGDRTMDCRDRANRAVDPANIVCVSVTAQTSGRVKPTCCCFHVRVQHVSDLTYDCTHKLLSVGRLILVQLGLDCFLGNGLHYFVLLSLPGSDFRTTTFSGSELLLQHVSGVSHALPAIQVNNIS